MYTGNTDTASFIPYPMADTPRTLPAFALQGSDGATYTQDSLAAGTTVLYSYPRDNTPGCTLEALDFTRLLPQFATLGVRVLGISGDSHRSHCGFAAKQGLQHVLLADEDRALLAALGAIQEKSMYGKTYLGINRNTYIIRDGQIVHEWEGVRAQGHAEEVLRWVEENT